LHKKKKCPLFLLSFFLPLGLRAPLPNALAQQIFTSILLLEASSFTTQAHAISDVDFSSPYYLALDKSDDSLYLSDRNDVVCACMNNNRVLRIPSPGVRATQVFGQVNFAAFNGQASQTGLSRPKGVALDNVGNVFVADSLNNRVLMYLKGGAITGQAAQVVFGQPDFTLIGAGTSFAQMSNPIGVAVSLMDGALYVADSSNDRIMKFVRPFASNGSPAVQVYTAGLDDPQGLVLDPSDNLYCSNAGNNRIFLFLRGSTVVAQSFGGTGLPTAASLTTLNLLAGLAMDSASNLYAADFGYNSVL
jgi:DNA-binding beta-propeller fold protein YncE